MRAQRPDFAGNRGGQMANRMGPTRPNLDFTMGATMPGSKLPPKVNAPPNVRIEGGNYRPQIGGAGNLNIPPPMRHQGFAPPPPRLPPAHIPPSNLPPPNLPSSSMTPPANIPPTGMQMKPPPGFKPGSFVPPPPGSMGMSMGGPPLQGPRPMNVPGPFPPTIGNPPQMAPPKQPQPPQTE